jgi:hypothetical protein
MPIKRRRTRKSRGGSIIDTATDAVMNTWGKAKQQYNESTASYANYMPQWLKSSGTTSSQSTYTPQSYSTAPPTPPTPTAVQITQPQSYGGKKRGGATLGKLGLAYYASPIHNSKTAEPTYMISGGGKRTRKNKRTSKRHRRKTHMRRR